MNQKIKSLIYFTCFVIASLTYYTVELQEQANDSKENTVAKASIDNTDTEALEVAVLK